MINLILACATGVNPHVMQAIVQHESGGHPWVIHNNTRKESRYFETKEEAIKAASSAIAKGESVDMGLAQINSQNLPRLRLTVEQVFEPCVNLRAGAQILAEGLQKTGSLMSALSMYNTGGVTVTGMRYASTIISRLPPDSVKEKTAWITSYHHTPSLSPAASPFSSADYSPFSPVWR